MDFLPKKAVSLHCICLKSVHLAFPAMKWFLVIASPMMKAVSLDPTPMEHNFTKFPTTKLILIAFKSIQMVSIVIFQAKRYPRNFNQCNRFPRKSQIVLISSMIFPSADFDLKDFQSRKKLFRLSQLLKGVSSEFLLMELIFIASSWMKWISMVSLRTKFNSVDFPRMKSIFNFFSSMKSFPTGLQSTIFGFHLFPIDYRLIEPVFFCLKLTFMVFILWFLITNLLLSNRLTWHFYHRKWNRCVALSNKSISKLFSSTKPLSIYFPRTKMFSAEFLLEKKFFIYSCNQSKLLFVDADLTSIQILSTEAVFEENIQHRFFDERFFLGKLRNGSLSPTSIFIDSRSLTKNSESYPWMKMVHLWFWLLKLVSMDFSSTIASSMDFLSMKPISLQCICSITVHLAFSFSCCTIDGGSFHGSYCDGTQFHEFSINEFQFDWFRIDSILFHGFPSNWKDINGILTKVAVSLGNLIHKVLISSIIISPTDFVLKDVQSVEKAFLVFTDFKRIFLRVLVDGVDFHSFFIDEINFNGFSDKQIGFLGFPMNEINIYGFSSMTSFSIGLQSFVLVFVDFPLTTGCLHGFSFA